MPALSWHFCLLFVLKSIVMAADKIFIAHPTTNEQIDALKAFAKKINIDFEVTAKEDTIYFCEELQSSLNQVQEIIIGKLPKESAKDFLNELGCNYNSRF